MHLQRLSVRNFRSIRKQDVELAPITVIYGPNGAGKSSLLYAPLVLRNLAISPHQTVPSLFNLGFLNLGGFKEVVFGRQEDESLSLAISTKLRMSETEVPCEFRVTLNSQNAVEFAFSTRPFEDAAPFQVNVSTSLPYQLSQQVELDSTILGLPLAWDGLNWKHSGSPPPDLTTRLAEILTALNSPVERLRKISFAPVTRGFFQPQYSPVGVGRPLQKEQELATILVTDRDLEAKVSTHLERICGRQFRARPELGTSIFTLQIIDPQRDLATELVNDGFGVNQVVYMLALALWRETSILIIEEPEIHLHPTMIRKFLEELVGIAKLGKQFIISTHSESLVSSCLGIVARRLVEPSFFACYLALRERGDLQTQFERQQIEENGQIQKGLKNFVEAELDDLKVFLGIQEH